MKNTRRHEPVPTAGSELPQPRRGARWRWSTPRRTLVAGGAVATVLSLGAGTVAAGAITRPSTAAGPRGRPPAGARPTVMGKVTARRGNDITVQTRGKRSTTVVYSSTTTFTSLSGPGASSGANASALEVGSFIAAQGTRNGDGSVTARSIVISTGPPPLAEGGAPATRGAPAQAAPSA